MSNLTVTGQQLDESNPVELARQVLTGEVVEDVWEDSVSEWTTGASQAIVGQLRQARAAANVTRVHGTNSMKQFAEEVGASKSTVYDYAKVWFTYGDLIEDGDSSLSRQLESGELHITKLIAKSRSANPLEKIEKIADMSSRQIEAQNQEEKQSQAEEDYGKPEVVETRVCEACGSVVPVEG